MALYGPYMEAYGPYMEARYSARRVTRQRRDPGYCRNL